jgi:hypothetical protein
VCRPREPRNPNHFSIGDPIDAVLRASRAARRFPLASGHARITMRVDRASGSALRGSTLPGYCALPPPRTAAGAEVPRDPGACLSVTKSVANAPVVFRSLQQQWRAHVSWSNSTELYTKHTYRFY